MSEIDLVRGLRERSPEAVQHLNECWVPSIWRFVYVRVGGDQHLAEDIVSETVLALITAAGDPDHHIENPGGWLRGVAANKVRDHFRAAARVQHLLDQAQQVTGNDEDDDPSGRQEQTERREAVRAVLDSLEDSYRMALEWKYIDRVSVREIAARLELTEKAAESVLFRARREFRERLRRRTDDVPVTGRSEKSPSVAADRGAVSRSRSSTESEVSEDDVEQDVPRPPQVGEAVDGEATRRKEAGRESDQGPHAAGAETDAVGHPPGAEHPIPVTNGE